MLEYCDAYLISLTATPAKHTFGGDVTENSLWDLPAGWCWAEAGQLIEDISAGKSFKCDERSPQQGEVGVVKVSAVTWGSYDEQESKTCTSPELVNPDLFVRPGDFLFSRANTIELVGACVIADRVTRDVMLSDKILRFSVRDGWKKWLLWVLRSSHGRAEIERVATGNQDSMRNIGQSRVLSIRVPLPANGEQDRIVEAVESYFTRLDDAVATLERVERNLERYRASVLKSAVEGRLVPTEAELARREGRDYEPASVLLERILAERHRWWSESGKKGKYQAPTRPDTMNLPDLPEGWCWATVESLIWDADYGTSQKCTYEATGPAVLRIPNVQEQTLRLDDLKFATNPDELNTDGAVKVGDLVFIRTNGSRNLIGRGAVVLDELPTPHHFASYLIRLRVLPVRGLPRWIGFAWHTPTLREQILDEAASSAGQYNVSMKAATGFVVPLAPAAEQERILAEVERIDSLAEATFTAVLGATERSARLRQAILKWAFEGKLADRDPNDEPAAVLLERIQAERETGTPAKAVRPQRDAGKKQRS